ncbi:sigma 54-interacting transcriptional regulator [Xanthomarina sp. F2636L]|uniref:sigma 54-interacting transcriptional regulator n=1 Tax=Xanthomarina sp. F2636L TaxID=2996018 RepID=UPI00225E3432|nr:sigma 54-interacting transcriptional regulator [Xanthomarina sp. F2636L]MCX7550973.1 sigma 54-interacting transcriptional regulator [Xanthomarina sp. F2636L]
MNPSLKHILNGIDPVKFAKILHKNTLLCLINMNGEFTYISEPLCSLLGYEEQDLLFKNIILLQPFIQKQSIDEAWWQKLKQQKYWEGQISLCERDGDKRSLTCDIVYVEDPINNQPYYLGKFNLQLPTLDFQDYIENDSSYNWLFKKSPIPKSLISLKTLQYVDVNRSWETYTGYKKELILERTPKELKFHSLVNLDFLTNIKTSSQTSFQIDKAVLLLNSKEKKRAILTYEKVYIHDEPFLLEIITDITERIKYLKELKYIYKKSVQKKDAILRLAGLIGDDLDYIFEEITKTAAKTMQVERISIWKFHDKYKNLKCIKAYSLSNSKHSEGIELNANDYTDYYNSLFKNKTIKVNNVLKDKRTKNFLQTYLNSLGITSTLDVLIPGHSGHYGVLCIEHTGPPKEWTIEEEEFASSISNFISLAVESNERIVAETKLIKTNQELVNLNSELNKLKKKLEQENIYLREEIDLVFNYEEMVYGSKSFSDVLTDVERVAVTNATVLLLGESGTGKELLARAIHNISDRRNKPLIKVNCAAIPRELIESELFGHKKGSFTGAAADKLGKFQLADGGTLFLDEIGELPIEMQPKLLRAIQESEIEQVGGTKTQKVDIRIITATNRDLEKEVKEKNFREDLYFRINVFPITIPPLRERVEDIPILIEHFVDKYSKLYNKNIKYTSEETKRDLQSYSWPGNIRELENLIERSVILSNNEKLIIPNFKTSSSESLISSTVLSLDDVQRIHIKKVLKSCNWVIEGPEGAAEQLQIKPSTLRDRMKKLGIYKS